MTIKRRDILLALGASAALPALSLAGQVMGGTPPVPGIGTGLFILRPDGDGEGVWMTNAECEAHFPEAPGEDS